MSSEHTKGPWRSARDGGPASKVFIFGTQHGAVGKTFRYNENGEADARLIAAAPEMYEALMGLRLDLAYEYEGRLEASLTVTCDALHAAIAALAKARGGANE